MLNTKIRVPRMKVLYEDVEA